MTARDPRCTCGSGAHPRRCEAHPYGFDLHCAALNLDYGIQEVGLPDDDDPITCKELLERLDEYERQVRAALKWWRERCDTLTEERGKARTMAIQHAKTGVAYQTEREHHRETLRELAALVGIGRCTCNGKYNVLSERERWLFDDGWVGSES